MSSEDAVQLFDFISHLVLHPKSNKLCPPKPTWANNCFELFDIRNLRGATVGCGLEICGTLGCDCYIATGMDGVSPFA